MPETLYSALTLLLIGMITVFTILFLVVISGNVLIRLVNKYLPSTTEKYKSFLPTESKTAIPAKKIAVIVAAIEAVSEGKARIVKIERKE